MVAPLADAEEHEEHEHWAVPILQLGLISPCSGNQKSHSTFLTEEEIQQVALDSEHLRAENRKLKEAIKAARCKVVRTKTEQNQNLKLNNQELSGMLDEARRLVERREELRRIEATEGPEAVATELEALRDARRHMRRHAEAAGAKPARASPGMTLASPSDNFSMSPQTDIDDELTHYAFELKFVPPDGEAHSLALTQDDITATVPHESSDMPVSPKTEAHSQEQTITPELKNVKKVELKKLVVESDELKEENRQLREAIKKARSKVKCKVIQKKSENQSLKINNQELADLLQQVRQLVDHREELRKRELTEGPEAVAAEIEALRDARRILRKLVQAISTSSARAAPGMALASHEPTIVSLAVDEDGHLLHSQ